MIFGLFISHLLLENVQGDSALALAREGDSQPMADDGDDVGGMKGSGASVILLDIRTGGDKDSRNGEAQELFAWEKRMMNPLHSSASFNIKESIGFVNPLRDSSEAMGADDLRIGRFEIENYIPDAISPLPQQISRCFG